jgi:hypothetical protein
MFSTRWPTPLATLLRHSAKPQPSSSPFSPSYTRSLCSTTTRTTSSSSRLFLHRYRLALALSLPAGALALSALDSRKPLECASDRSYATAPPPSLDTASGAAVPGQPKEAESILNLRDLGFGTVSGICVGIFVKKGLKVRRRCFSSLPCPCTDLLFPHRLPLSFLEEPSSSFRCVSSFLQILSLPHSSPDLSTSLAPSVPSSTAPRPLFDSSVPLLPLPHQRQLALHLLGLRLVHLETRRTARRTRRKPSRRTVGLVHRLCRGEHSAEGDVCRGNCARVQVGLSGEGKEEKR